MGPSLAKPVLEKVTSDGEFQGLKIRWGAASMQGWSKHMEDRYTCDEVKKTSSLQGHSFFGVFDGHGGDKVSTKCQEQLLEKILVRAESLNCKDDSLPQQEKTEPEVITQVLRAKVERAPNKNKLAEKKGLNSEQIEKCIREGFLDLDEYLEKNQALLLKSEESVDGEPEKSGSTAVCAFVSNKYIYLANCGDSRGVLAAGGKTVYETQDHKPTLEEEKKRIDEAGGIVYGNRVNGVLAVSRTIGDFDFKTAENLSRERQAVSPLPDVKCLPRNGDEEFLILACDGVWDVMENDELVDYVRYLMQCTRKAGKTPIKDICENVVDTCLAKGSHDNITIMIIAFGAAPKFDENVARRDEDLNRRLEIAVDEVLKKSGDSTIGVSTIMEILAVQDIAGLPPGGGLASKRYLIENKLNALPQGTQKTDPPTVPYVTSAKGKAALVIGGVPNLASSKQPPSLLQVEQPDEPPVTALGDAPKHGLRRSSGPKLPPIAEKTSPSQESQVMMLEPKRKLDAAVPPNADNKSPKLPLKKLPIEKVPASSSTHQPISDANQPKKKGNECDSASKQPEKKTSPQPPQQLVLEAPRTFPPDLGTDNKSPKSPSLNKLPAEKAFPNPSTALARDRRSGISEESPEVQDAIIKAKFKGATEMKAILKQAQEREAADQQQQKDKFKQRSSVQAEIRLVKQSEYGGPKGGTPSTSYSFPLAGPGSSSMGDHKKVALNNKKKPSDV